MDKDLNTNWYLTINSKRSKFKFYSLVSQNFIECSQFTGETSYLNSSKESNFRVKNFILRTN